MSDKIYRIVNRLTDGKWSEVNFNDLKKDDVFTLQDPPEMAYVEWKGNKVFHALSDAYFDEEFQELTILMESHRGDEVNED
jgi:hypothetical protein